MFLETHYAPLFSFKYEKFKKNEEKLNLLKLNYLTQSEFHKIILWSNEIKNYISLDFSTKSSSSISDDNLAIIELNLRINDINTIISILSSKIQQ